MSDDDFENTVISSRGKQADEVDDATVVVRRTPVDDETVIVSRQADIEIDETVIVTRSSDIDETVISSRATDIDETVISRRGGVEDATVISRKSKAVRVDAVPATRAKKAPASSTNSAMFRAPAPPRVRTPPSVDDTVIGSRSEDLDSTVISERNNSDVDETVISSRTSQPDIDETVMSSRTSEPDIDETVISSRTSELDADATVMSSRNADETIVASGDSDATILGSRQRESQLAPEDATVIAGAAEVRTPRAPDAHVGEAQEFVRLGEPVTENVERVDFGTPPPRIHGATDPAFVYESAMKQRQKRARRLVILLVGSAVALGVILAVAIVLLARP